MNHVSKLNMTKKSPKTALLCKFTVGSIGLATRRTVPFLGLGSLMGFAPKR